MSLREMSKLKKQVKDNLVTNQEFHLESTYRQAFNQLKGKQKKFAGCHNFAKFF